MKKLLSFLLIFSIFVPTIWAYDLTDKDKIIVQRASTAIEKMITRKGENYRAKYVIALQKLGLRFQNNPRMQKIIGETANVLSDDTSGLESVFINADTSVNSPVVDVPKKEPVAEVVVPVKNNTQDVAVVNQVTVRKCYMENGEGQETFSNNTWGSCDVVSCSGGYEKINNQCSVKCSSSNHREGISCVSNTKSCIASNMSGQQVWNGGSWGGCKTSNPAEIGEEVKFETSTTSPLSQTFAPGQDGAKLMFGSITSSSEVILDDITLNYTTSELGSLSMETVYLQIYSYVDSTSSIYSATPIDLNTTSGILLFKKIKGSGIFKGKGNIYISTKLKNTAIGTIKMDSLDLSKFATKKYSANQSPVVLTSGSIEGVNLTISKTTLNVNSITNLDTNITPGAKFITVFGARFSTTQGNSINLSNLSINTTGTLKSLSGEVSLTFYIDGVAKATKKLTSNNINFDMFNPIISRSSYTDITIKADFSDSITSGTFGISSILYNAMDSVTQLEVADKPSVSGPLFTINP